MVRCRPKEPKFSPCFFVHHKGHTDWPRVQSEPQHVGLQIHNLGSLYVYGVPDWFHCFVQSVHTVLTNRKTIYLLLGAPLYQTEHGLQRVLFSSTNCSPVPIAARSKAYVCGRSPAEIAGLNPTWAMDLCLL